MKVFGSWRKSTTSSSDDFPPAFPTGMIWKSNLILQESQQKHSILCFSFAPISCCILYVLMYMTAFPWPDTDSYPVVIIHEMRWDYESISLIWLLLCFGSLKCFWVLFKQTHFPCILYKFISIYSGLFQNL